MFFCFTVSLQASPSASDYALRATTGQDDPTGCSVRLENNSGVSVQVLGFRPYIPASYYETVPKWPIFFSIKQAKGRRLR